MRHEHVVFSVRIKKFPLPDVGLLKGEHSPSSLGGANPRGCQHRNRAQLCPQLYLHSGNAQGSQFYNRISFFQWVKPSGGNQILNRDTGALGLGVCSCSLHDCLWRTFLHCSTRLKTLQIRAFGHSVQQKDISKTRDYCLRYIKITILDDKVLNIFHLCFILPLIACEIKEMLSLV